jgi:hypothetical protein
MGSMLARGFALSQLFSLAIVVNCSSDSNSGTPPTPDASTVAADASTADAQADAAGSCTYRRIAASYTGRRQVEHLVIALDASRTMCTVGASPGADFCVNPASNWRVAGNGIFQFSQSQRASGLKLSVIPWWGSVCTAAFNEPVLGGRLVLPFPKLEVLLKSNPATSSDAPPLGPAIRGISAYANPKAGANVGEPTAFALLTAGAGSGACGGLASGVTEVSNAKNAGMAPFILGFGGSIGDINALAQAAGTNGGKAFAINAAEDVQKALEQIAFPTSTCQFKPAAPVTAAELKTLRFGGSQGVPWKSDCADGNAFRIVSESPLVAELCPSACAAAAVRDGIFESGPDCKPVFDGRVRCGPTSGAAQYCDAGQVCCAGGPPQNAATGLKPYSSFVCAKDAAACPALPEAFVLGCDTGLDCASGGRCCLVPGAPSRSTCNADCSQTTLCDPSGAGIGCPNGLTCNPSVTLPGYGICR